MQILDKRLPIAWFLGIPFSYFVVSYLENFYHTPFQVALWTIFIHSFLNLFAYYLISKVTEELRADFVSAVLAGILFIALAAFVPFVYSIARPYTNLFDAAVFHLGESVRVSFLNALIPSFFIAAAVTYAANQRNWKETRFFKFMEENSSGLMIAFLFFCVYLIYASIFNRPTYDADDIFFDADSNLYRWRYATEKYGDYYWRPVHPFILIIIRPLVGILAFIFRGDTLFAAITLNALVGALCVFLVWYFVKHSVRKPLYAILISALFGASASQLAFGSLIESYIYLSAVALIFLVLLLKDSPLWMQVLAGLAAFGITISNVAQTFIAHFFVKRDIKKIIIYGLLIGVFVVPLSLLNNYIYPESNPYFWDLTTLEGEDKNQFPITVQRADYLVRVMALHSFVSPEPLVIRDGFPFPKVWMFRASIKKDPMQLATYETLLGNGLVAVWLGLLVLGGVLFFKNIRKQDNGYFLTFIVTLMMYFALHLRYGKDAFLYSTNWTYAIVLFLALSWRELAEKRWFQVVLLIFILLLMVNNSEMYKFMLEISAPSVKFPVWR